MAALTKTELADRALEALGILGAGQSSSGEDNGLAQSAVDTVHGMLRKELGLPFATSAIPEWAQSALTHLTALELCAIFGITGARMQAVTMLADKGRSDLATQMAAMRQPVPTRVDYF
jgi:hypothetical protein